MCCGLWVNHQKNNKNVRLTNEQEKNGIMKILNSRKSKKGEKRGYKADQIKSK